MQKSGRYLLGLLAVVAGFTQPFALYSWAQTYPVKPIRILVGVVPGGSTDVTARLVGQKLSDHHGRSSFSAERKTQSHSLINTPEEFAAFIHREIEQNIKLIKLTGVKAE